MTERTDSSTLVDVVHAASGTVMSRGTLTGRDGDWYAVTDLTGRTDEWHAAGYDLHPVLAVGDVTTVVHTESDEVMGTGEVTEIAHGFATVRDASGRLEAYSLAGFTFVAPL